MDLKPHTIPVFVGNKRIDVPGHLYTKQCTLNTLAFAHIHITVYTQQAYSRPQGDGSTHVGS